MSSTNNPVHLHGIVWPLEWEARASLVRTVLALASAFLLLCLVIGILAILGGDADGLILVVIAATLISGTPIAYVVNIACRRRTAAHVSRLMVSGKGVAFLATSRAAKCSFFGLSAVCLLTLATSPVFAWIMPPDGSFANTRFRLFAAVAPILGLYFLGVLCSRIVRKRGEMGLGLSPEGIYYWTWFGCCFFAWDWISEIQLTSRTGPGVRLQVHEPLQHPTNPEENWIAEIDYFRNKKSQLNLGLLAINPAVALHALVFYYQHPDLRPELSTELAIARIRRGDLHP